MHFVTNETDVKDEKITLTDGELKFVGKSEDKDYEVNIEFFNTVDAEGSTYKVLPRSVQMHILKKDVKEDDEFWPRLLKDKALEKNQVKIDWDRYVDEGKFYLSLVSMFVLVCDELRMGIFFSND